MNVIDLKPADTPDYMTQAWLGCIHWAIGDPDVVAAFRRETGNQWQPARTGFEQLIDRATVSDWHFIQAFVGWVNREIWGPIDGNTEQ